MTSKLPPVISSTLPPVIEKKRFHDMDALRAFAMLLGIVLHAMLSFAPGIQWVGRDINQSALYAYGVDAIHGFRMPVFFLVSGFFTAMMWRGRGVRGLIKHRVQRVLLPLLIFGSILTPMLIAVSVYAGTKQASVFQAAGADTVVVNAHTDVRRTAANRHGIDVLEGEAQAGREVSAGRLQELDAATEATAPQLGFILEQLPSWLMVTVLILCMSPVFNHLWFLYYLLWLVAGFVVVVWIAKKLNWRRVPAWFMASPLRLLWLIPAAFVPQFFMAMSFGADTAIGIIPWPPKLLYYGVFFAFGATCFGHDDFENKVGRYWPASLAVSVPTLVAGLYFLGVRKRAYAAGFDENWYEVWISHTLCTGFTVLYTWLMIFGLIGFFRAFYSSEKLRVRYVSDSSYWLYLMHLPLIIFLQALVSDWPYPSPLKFLMVCVVASATLIVLYETMVRYTWIGTLLNGKKTRTNNASLPKLAVKETNER